MELAFASSSPQRDRTGSGGEQRTGREKRKAHACHHPSLPLLPGLGPRCSADEHLRFDLSSNTHLQLAACPGTGIGHPNQHLAPHRSHTPPHHHHTKLPCLSFLSNCWQPRVWLTHQSRPRLLFCLLGATWRHTSDGDASCWVLGRQVQDIQTHTGTDAPRPRLSKSRDTYVHALGLPASSPARRQPESGFFVTSHFPIAHNNYPCFSCKPPPPAPHPSRLPLVLVHVWPISISFFEATRVCPTPPLVSCVGGLPTTQYAKEGTLQTSRTPTGLSGDCLGGQPGDLLLF